MSDLKVNHSGKQPALIRQGGTPGHARTLQTANREALRHLGLPMEVTKDPKGRQLRHLRLQLGIDPSLLATHACISLSQLYELENGDNSRFYSDALRRQAGRRVARLLGADWDRMQPEDRHQGSGTSNVVALQRPGMHPQFATVIIQDTLPPLTTNAISAAKGQEETHVPIGLTTPATETLFITPSSALYAANHDSGKKRSTGWSASVSLLLIIAAGAAAIYMWSEHSLLRLT